MHRIIGLFTVIVFTILGAPGATSAQINPVQIDFAVQPRFPEPGETVRIDLEAYSINTTGSEIRWYINEREQADFRNLREMSYTAGELGDTANVSVVIQRDNGRVIGEVSKSITPARVDIILEPDTTIPTGYRGSALPSLGSQVRAIALPHEQIYRAPSAYTYDWSLNGRSLYRGSSAGSYTAEFDVPKQSSYITVDVYDEQGVQVARETMELPIVEPEVYFYIDNPLRGTQAQTARSPYDMRTEQITLQAAPYHLPAIDDMAVNWEWNVNSRPVRSGGDNPLSLTVERQRDNAQVPISFSLRHTDPEYRFQGVDDSIVIRF